VAWGGRRGADLPPSHESLGGAFFQTPRRRGCDPRRAAPEGSPRRARDRCHARRQRQHGAAHRARRAGRSDTKTFTTRTPSGVSRCSRRSARSSLPPSGCTLAMPLGTPHMQLAGRDVDIIPARHQLAGAQYPDRPRLSFSPAHLPANRSRKRVASVDPSSTALSYHPRA
jgi:hypothetical protein